MRWRALVPLAAVIALLGGAAGCGEDPAAPAQRDAGRPPLPVETQPPKPFEQPSLRFAPYEPPAVEPYVNGKRIAGRVAQRLATYDPGTTAVALAATVAPRAMAPGELGRMVAPLIQADRRSSGEVLYAQLSGVTPTTLGVMVVVRQHLEEPYGRRSSVTRVFDVRLSRTTGPWSLERVGSVGGTPVPRPARLSAAAARVVDHPNIMLPDSARWDIYSGAIDDGLLGALANAADRRRIAIAVLRTGHPANVWATTRQSAHTSGYAADIYAVDGRLVVTQRANGSAAQQLAAAFLAGGAKQVGSPWVLPPAGTRSFTDAVHQDHIHVQQVPLPPAAPIGG